MKMQLSKMKISFLTTYMDNHSQARSRKKLSYEPLNIINNFKHNHSLCLVRLPRGALV